ncbi:class I SAM-dependent methyltransferase [Dermabacteraceae bacterium CCM 9520]
MSEQVKGQRQGPEEKRLQGHWLLAKMGKKVLRPGGMEMTSALLTEAAPQAEDDIVEYGPGVGRTAQILLSVQPRSYTAVDPNLEAAAELAAVISPHPQARRITADAADTGLAAESVTLVVGEAMLTMQSESDKLRVMRESLRILKPGGRYVIHELAFTPDHVSPARIGEVSRELARTIKVGARPLTCAHWRELLESAGFEVCYEWQNPMALLRPARLIKDEGPLTFLKFAANVLRNPAARERVGAMRKVFNRNRDNLCAVGFVVRKPI